MARQPVVIDWDGLHVPPELRQLPPGRYVVEPAEEDTTLTAEEEDGILTALNSLDAGRGTPLSDVIREIREKSRPR